MALDGRLVANIGVLAAIVEGGSFARADTNYEFRSWTFPAACLATSASRSNGRERLTPSRKLNGVKLITGETLYIDGGYHIID